MSDASTDVTVQGTVEGLQFTGYDRNSGELTLTLGTPNDNGGVTQAFAGIMDEAGNGNEQGVFLSYATVAGAALIGKKRVQCSYVIADEWRIKELTFLRD